MKKTSFKISMMAIIIATLFSTSCKKEKTNEIDGNNDPKTTYSSVYEFIKSLAPEMQKFTINATTGGTIKGTAGTNINFTAGSLMKSGVPVTGNVEITLQEIRTKRDMMSTGVFTGSFDGQILESDGMFFIDARQDGVQLEIDPNNPMEVEMPAVDNLPDSTMILFIGVADSINRDNVAWKPNKVPVGNSQNAYVFKWYNFGFCNIDRYYDPNCSGDLEITIPSNYDPNKTSIMIIFEDVHAEAATYKLSSGKFATLYCLPLNRKIKLLCVSIIDEKLYFSLTDETTEATMRYTIPEGKLTSEVALDAILKSF